MSDPDLLHRLRLGDHDAFDAIFRTHYPQLVGVAEAMLGERAVAEEIVQDVLLEVWRRRQSLEVETSLRAYLFRATRNRALNHLRHQHTAREAAPFIATADSTPAVADDQLVEQQIQVALTAAIGALPERCREVFELSRVHGLKYAEIAGVLDISVKTVEAQMGKALRTLRERLAPWLPNGGGL